MKVTLPRTTLSSSDGATPRAPRRSRLPIRLRWVLIAVGLLVVIIVVARQAIQPAPATTATATPAVSRLIAHGIVQPVSQARVGTLGGGVLLGISVAIGETVEAQHELARVRGQADVEVLTAPFAGTVTGILAHTGDTLLPGAGVVLVADLGRLEVDTTDVDEFLIGHIRPGMMVSLEVEALDQREITGRVQSVALQPQTTAGGDQHYPVTIDLGGTPPDLRPGMSVRITLPG